MTKAGTHNQSRVRPARKPMDPMTIDYLQRRHRGSVTLTDAMAQERRRQRRIAKRDQRLAEQAHMTGSPGRTQPEIAASAGIARVAAASR